MAIHKTVSCPNAWRASKSAVAVAVAVDSRRTGAPDRHGDAYIFRGRRGDLIKCLWHDGLGLSLYAKRLERGRSCGPRRRTARAQSCPPNSAVYSKGSTGGTRNGPGVLRRSAEGIRVIVRAAAPALCSTDVMAKGFDHNQAEVVALRAALAAAEARPIRPKPP